MPKLSFDMFKNCSRDLYENFYELAVGMIGKHRIEVEEEEYGKTVRLTHDLEDLEDIEEKLETIIKYSLPESCYKLPKEHREAYTEFYKELHPPTESEEFRAKYFPVTADMEEIEANKIDQAYRKEVIQHAKNIWFHGVLLGKTAASHPDSQHKGAYSKNKKNEDKEYASKYDKMIPDDTVVKIEYDNSVIPLKQLYVDSCYEYDDAAYLTGVVFKEELQAVNPDTA